MRKIIFFLILAGMVFSPFSAIAEYSVDSAESYLSAHANNPWSTMALAALGANNIPTDYLKSVNGATAIEYAAPILAISAAGFDPRTFGDKDYVAELKKYFTGGQLGDPATNNDDIFGLLALVSAGEQTSDPMVVEIKNFLLLQQQTNGGWGFSGGSDSNMTAAAIVALIAGGVPGSDSSIQNGFNYLKTAQNDDGGFTYDPQSSYGTASDSSSTAWAMWALAAASINPESWSKSGNSPAQYLISNQSPDGYFKYQSNSSEDAFSPVTTAYSVIALAGKTLPLISTASPLEFPYRIEGMTGTVCEGKTFGPTALDIVKNASQSCGFTYHIQSTSFGPYLDQIGEDKAEGAIGWLYLVNYLSPAVGAADYVLKSGDSVLWFFGGYDWKPARLSLSETEVASGGAIIATVEFFDNSGWLPLESADVVIGASRQSSDSGGKATLTATDGYYKVAAEKEGYVRSNSVFLKVGNPDGTNIGLKVNIQKGEVRGASVSFTIDPSSLDFGTLKPGQSAGRDLIVNNTGTSGILVRSAVSGDEVFVNHLRLDGSSWQSFEKQLTSGQTQTVNAGLNIPADYSGSEGNKSGAITIWATAE